MLEFQREIYETNFPGFVVDQQFLRDYGDQIRRATNNPAEALFVLEEDKRACGFLWLSLISTMIDPCVGYIRNIYVAQHLRGQGYGKRLMAFAEEWCLSKEVDKLALDASCCNEYAVNLYREAGFETVRLRMEKPLRKAEESEAFEGEFRSVLGGEEDWT